MSADHRTLALLAAVALAGGALAACDPIRPSSPAPPPPDGPPPISCTTEADCGAPTACRATTCTNGTCTFEPSAATTCADSGGRVCDGAGACVECNRDEHCPVPDDVCLVPNTVACLSHACQAQYYAGEPPSGPLTQTPGDCHELRCGGGTSGLVADVDVTDVPTTATASDCLVWECVPSGSGADTIWEPAQVATANGTPCAGGSCDLGVCR